MPKKFIFVFLIILTALSFLSFLKKYPKAKTKPAVNISQTIYKPTPPITPFDPGQISIPIFTYHYVEYIKDPGDYIRRSLDIIPLVFVEQLRALKEASYTTVFMKDVGDYFDGKKTLPKKSIVLTFDDGYRSFYTDVFPILKKYNAKATIYIIVDFLEYPNFLTKKQLKEIADSGLVEIGSHTLNHANVKTVNIEEARKEIFESKSKLEEIIGKPVYDFCYPYGAYNKNAEQLVKDAGYLTATSTKAGDIQSLENRFSLLRLRPGYRIGKNLINWLENYEKK